MDQETNRGITRVEHLPFTGIRTNCRLKSDEKYFRKVITKICCKVCAKHKDEALNDPTLNGVAATAAKAFICGTVLRSIR